MEPKRPPDVPPLTWRKMPLAERMERARVRSMGGYPAPPSKAPSPDQEGEDPTPDPQGPQVSAEEALAALPAQDAAKVKAAEHLTGTKVPRLVVTSSPVPPTPIPNQSTEDAIRRLLVSLGLDPDSEGLRDTPMRVAKWWHEFMFGQQNGRLDAAFTSESHDELVLVKGIEAWSVCEHHLLPFRLDVAIAYIGRDRMVGLSKLARCVYEAARGPNVQERITERAADLLEHLSGSPDVAVVAEGEHLCMSMRGVRQSGATTITSVMRGRFREEERARAEVLALAGRR